MNEKNKPQGFNLGLPLDVESITDNCSDLDRLTDPRKYLHGDSSPIITDDDIAQMMLIPDRNFADSYEAANLHLKALGLMPIWSKSDYARVQLYKWQLATWNSYLEVTK
jgi:hypothetical protein